MAPKDAGTLHDRWYIQKPFGFSYFPKEIAAIPRAWVSTTGNLIFWREHDKVSTLSLTSGDFYSYG